MGHPYGLASTHTWRIIPVFKWFITVVSFPPRSRVVGPLPNGSFMTFKRGLLLTTYDTWDEPPPIGTHPNSDEPRKIPWLVRLYRALYYTQSYRDYNKPL